MNLAGSQIPYTLVSSRLARTMHIKISLQKGLEVVVPARFNSHHLDEFLASKKKWILRHLENIGRARAVQQSFGDGIKIPILGQPVTIRIEKHIKSKTHVSECADELRIFCDGTPADAKKALSAWLKKTATEYLNQKTHELARIMNVTYERITIRSQTSRWGSCSNKNNLNFNWKLILFEPEVINYVIMHELAHTMYHDHSEKFYSFLEQFCPNYKIIRKKLKNGHLPF